MVVVPQRACAEPRPLLTLLLCSTVLDFLRRDVGLEQPVIQVQVVLPPVHGALCVRTLCNATATQPFSSAQLAAGEVLYRHDHSDTTWDEVALSLLLAPGDVLLGNVSIPVTVLPVNDQPFRMSEPSPQLSVVSMGDFGFRGARCCIMAMNRVLTRP